MYICIYREGEREIEIGIEKERYIHIEREGQGEGERERERESFLWGLPPPVSSGGSAKLAIPEVTLEGPGAPKSTQYSYGHVSKSSPRAHTKRRVFQRAHPWPSTSRGTGVCEINAHRNPMHLYGLVTSMAPNPMNS